MPFSEDDAIEIASASKESQDFEKKYPECVWNVEKMSTKEAEKWIKEHPKINVTTTTGKPLKTLWLVEIEELDTEKVVLIINPDSKKVLDVKTEKLEPEPEEEEETEEGSNDDEEEE